MPEVRHLVLILLAGAAAGSARAAPELYTIEPYHTFPSFETTHMGVSIWRGKFDKSSGTIILDREKNTGKVDITIDTSSIDFGLPIMNERARSEDLFNVAKYPTATYKSASMTFDRGMPVSVDGQLTLLGITKPLRLIVTQFRCIQHPILKREVCGADAHAQLDRREFGMNYQSESGGDVRLAIQIEALKGEGSPAAGSPAKDKTAD